jgi:hypothetical protein
MKKRRKFKWSWSTLRWFPDIYLERLRMTKGTSIRIPGSE